MMELQLNRVDYMQAGITSANCLRLVPLAKKEATNKVAVADNSGTVHVFGMKKREIQTVFKSLPGLAVSRLQLGGPLGQLKDRIFVSSGSVVRGYSKKGKQFLDFNTNITESIKNMYVEGADLVLSGDYIYHHYCDCKDISYFLCDDKINDVICLPMEKVPDLTPVLACNDGVLRIFQNGEQACRMDVARSPQTLCLYQNDGGDLGDRVLYGTKDGRLGLVQISKFVQDNVWELENESRSGGVLCLGNFDIIGDGVLDLLVGRDDGQVEVYGFTDTDEPIKRFSHTCSESVTSVQGGHVGSPDYRELVVSTYAGWVMGLTTESVEKSLGSSKTSVSQDNVTMEKLEALRREVDELQKRVVYERDQYQASAQNSNRISAIAKFSINDKFMLSREDGCYMLSVEVQMAIDNVLIQSSVPLDILDVNTNSAVISFSNCDPKDSNCLLATYRCQANTTRMELKLRTIEGQHGTVLAYVTPKLQPKVCQVIQYQIKPLSLHCRSNTFDESRPLNRLSLTGNFSMAEMHSWVSFCLPDLPDRTPAGDSVIFYFSSTLLDTMLECSYKRGEVHFRSDNISTISILKDVLTKKATEKGIRLEITYDINEESIPHILKLLDPKLEYQISLAKKVHLIEALKDVQLQEGNVQFMSDEYQQILRDAEKLKAEYNRQPWHLERLHGMITDIYIDSYQFKGQDVRKQISQLMAILKEYTLSDLLEFFQISG